MSNRITVERIIANDRPIRIAITMTAMEWTSLLVCVENIASQVSRDGSERVTAAEIASARSLFLCNQKLEAQVVPALVAALQ